MKMNHAKKSLNACLLLAAVSLLAACGGGGGDSSDTPAPSPAPTPAPTPSVTANLIVPTSAEAGSIVTIDGSSSTSSIGAPLTYGLDLGDGTHGGAAKLAKVYAQAGNYSIVLTVLDNAGHSATATKQITISAGPTPGPTVQAQGFVRDLNDAPLTGVSASVITTATSATTDAQGKVKLSFPTAEDVLIKLTKTGYADQFVPLKLPVTTGADAYFEARLIAREAAQTLTDATQGGALVAKDGAKITLSGSSLVDLAGHTVSGAVQVTMTPVDVTKATIAGFPGQFAGVTQDAARTSIVSYGTVEFALTQNGQRLQLAQGQAAAIEIPVYANANADGTPLAAGAKVPLWSLDETTGLWIQEGVGTIVASVNSPTGLAMQASVGHFSWWNADKSIQDSFGPKPKCQDSGIGLPGSTDHLADATICNIFGMGASGGASGGVGSNKKAAAVATLSTPPGYQKRFTVPIGGGIPVKLPPDYPLLLNATALNGTWLGHVTIQGAAGTSPEIIIPMSPVTVAQPLETIILPFDQVRALPANQTARFGFTASSSLSVDVMIESGPSSQFTGQARLLRGTTVLATVSIGNSTAILNSAPLPAGDYVIEITNTGATAAVFGMQASLVHWSTQGGFISGLGGVFHFALAYDSQDRAVIMDVETYHPNGDVNTTNSRIAFRHLVNGAWTDAASAIELGANGLNADPTPCIGFALDRNGDPSYVAAIAGTYTANQWTGATWQAIGPNNGAIGGSSSSCSSAPTLRFDAANRLTVAYDTYSSLNGGTVHVVKFDGTAWKGVGPNGGIVTSGKFGLQGHSMELDSTGKPFVEWDKTNGGSTSPSVSVLRYVDTPTPAWVGVGSTSGQLPLVTGQSYFSMWGTHLVLDSQDRPVLAAALQGSGSNSWIGVFRFDGAAWSVSDAHSATGGPVSIYTSSPTINEVGLMMNAQDQPLVAWSETPPQATFNLYVQSWTAGAWQGLGATNGLINDPTLLVNPIVNRTVGLIRTAKDSHGNAAVAFYQYDINASAYRLGVSTYIP